MTTADRIAFLMEQNLIMAMQILRNQEELQKLMREESCDVPAPCPNFWSQTAEYNPIPY